jgi:hypothetical protein
VPDWVYQVATAVFCATACVNVLSLLLEDSTAKRQLALMTLTIKGVAACSHFQLLVQRPLLIYDAHGTMSVGGTAASSLPCSKLHACQHLDV